MRDAAPSPTPTTGSATASTRAPQPGAEVLEEPMRSRWSPSVFDAEHTLSRAEVEELLRAAQWAPSAGNSQPWAFFVCERGDANHQRLVPTLSRGNSGWVPRASLVLITAAKVGKEEGDTKEPSAYAVYDVGQAAAHVTLQARAMGLHAHQFAGFDHDALTEAFGVPESHRLLTGIAVGVHGDPAEVDERDAERETRPRTRRELSEWVHVDGWGATWT